MNNWENCHQPFLFKNYRDENCLLFCRPAGINTKLLYGESRYRFCDWKVFYKNLVTEVEYELPIPVKLPIDTDFNGNYIKDLKGNIIDFKHELNFDLSEIVICCNPHFYIREGKIVLFFTLGVLFNKNSLLQYFVSSIESENLEFNSLKNFKIWKYGFSGTVLDNNDILYVQEQKVPYSLDRLLIQKNGTNQKLEIPLSYFNIGKIFRVSNLFNSSNYIFTCNLNSDGLNHSFVLSNDFSKTRELFNSSGDPIYKSTFLSNLIAYTEVTKQGFDKKYKLIFEEPKSDLSKYLNDANEVINLPQVAQFTSLTDQDNLNMLKFPGLPDLVKAEENQSGPRTIVVDDNQQIGEYIQQDNTPNISQADNQDEQPSSYPTLMTMAKNFGSSMVNWAKSGFKVVTKTEMFNQRMDICRQCVEWDSEALSGTGRCRICGCATIAKLKLASERCPIDKWGPIEEIKE